MYARIFISVLMLLLVLNSCQEKKADFFEREAKEYTEKHCPTKMDAVTTLDSIVFVKGEDRIGDLLLYYSLSLDETSRKILMDNLGQLADMNLNDLRNSIALAMYKEEGVEFTYIYHDASTGEKIVEFHLTKKDYQ